MNFISNAKIYISFELCDALYFRANYFLLDIPYWLATLRSADVEEHAIRWKIWLWSQIRVDLLNRFLPFMIILLV